ncbi:hypothetical protein CSIM01_01693 [Colletotrichum simmondsii]|uniref:Uncharacterized protein n=1 Tax=Colletotrichum simmondsii TaxID=703756 RepID=A0A135T455_9PEZI|nr:hypothetical protein CSIM01_01693 [Colletotrichum simmondsii]
MRGTMTEGCVTSHRLTPGMEHAELTWNQKRQMLLGSKRVPAWHFKLRVECPSVIQLGNPAAIPFRLNIIPNRAKSSELLRDVLQKVYLTNALRERGIGAVRAFAFVQSLGTARAETSLSTGPDYITYCFSFAHIFKWKFNLVIAGESWECSGSQKVVVLPAVERAAAANTQSLPPPAGAAEKLPAYNGTRGPVPAYENVVSNGESSTSGYEKS